MTKRIQFWQYPNQRLPSKDELGAGILNWCRERTGRPGRFSYLHQMSHDDLLWLATAIGMKHPLAAKRLARLDELEAERLADYEVKEKAREEARAAKAADAH